MKRILILTFTLFILQSIFSISKINYNISFENRAHHEAKITVSYYDLPNKPLIINMSRSSPGKYALFEFAKNVYDEEAFDSQGTGLEIYRPNQHQWHIRKHNGTVIFKYTLFADHMDGTYSSINTEHIYLNIPATFVWVDGLEKIPIEIEIKNPEPKWKIVTQLVLKEKNVYQAPDLAYFIDSPIEITDFTIFEWNIASNGKTQKIRLALNHNENTDTINIFKKLVESVVQEQMMIFGGLPDFDYGEYTFIANYIPTAIYDGMEHRNSNVITSNISLKKEMVRNLRLLSHEFFHTWNVKRIRPRSLEPFNLMETNMSDELWFVEGFTTYFQDLIIYRLGLIDLNQLIGYLTSTINYVYNNPGNIIHSPVEMSQKATLFNGGIYEDPTNLGNIYISYYSYGAILALTLDLLLRVDYEGITLDDYMRTLWNDYGKTKTYYTNNDLLNTLAKLTGDKNFAENFFNRYIYGKELPDLKTLFAHAGIILKKRYPGKASIGRNWILNNQNGKIIINTYTLKNEPLYKAGLDKGDTILQLENVQIKQAGDITTVLNRYKPGVKIFIKYKNIFGKIMENYITLEEDRTLVAVTYEVHGLKISQNIKEFRNNWLFAKSSNKLEGIAKISLTGNQVFPITYNYNPYNGKKLNYVLLPLITTGSVKKIKSKAKKLFVKTPLNSCIEYPLSYRFCPFSGNRLKMKYVALNDVN